MFGSMRDTIHSIAIILFIQSIARTEQQLADVPITPSLQNYLTRVKNRNDPTLICPEGYYCDNVTKKQYPCGRIDVFCPPKSHKPTIVKVGHYTVGGTPTTRSGEKLCEPGSYCIAGIKYPCPAGRYGRSYGLVHRNCTGECLPGHYCTPGSFVSDQHRCGNPEKYCPRGSTAPSTVEKGFYSVGGGGLEDGTTAREDQVMAPVGAYAAKGLLFLCPAGRYGTAPGLSHSSCSGPCDAGFYCPPGATTPRQRICGGPDKFCPLGSAAPFLVRPGFYTSVVEEPCSPGSWRNYTTTQEEDREIYFRPKCVLCAAGTYKYEQGDEKELCRNCGNAATSTENRITCRCRKSTDVFDLTHGTCHPAAAPTDDDDRDSVVDASPFSTGSQLTRSREHPCEKGYYCRNGVRYPCPPGSYGSENQETSSSCRGECHAGYWCGPASTGPKEHECGGSHAYCPEGSVAPLYVTEGYFTNEDVLPSVRSYQSLCPPGHYCQNGIRYQCPQGRYGSLPGLTKPECTGRCLPGYFCPAASTNSTQRLCGNATVYCPEGSGQPQAVDRGFYSRHDQYEPEWRGVARDPGNTTMGYQEVCERGYYCVRGIKYSCPGGTFGRIIGADSADEACSACRAGYYCPSYPGPPSMNATARVCGRHKYCPAGSAFPTYIRSGYYGIGGVNDTTFTGELICPRGRYCHGSKMFDCPEGTFGNATGLKNKRCSGFCMAGYFCPRGSEVPLECPENTYATPGASKCIACNPASILEDSQKCRTRRECCGQ